MHIKKPRWQTRNFYNKKNPGLSAKHAGLLKDIFDVAPRQTWVEGWVHFIPQPSV
jgi:hypothetical protein